MKTSRSTFPFHTGLFAIYPILALLEANLGEVLLDSGIRMLAISLLFASFIGTVCWLFFRKLQPAAMAASILILVVLSYGHIYGSLDQVGIAGILLGRHRYLLPLSVIVCAAGILLARQSNVVPVFTAFLNAASVVLVALPILQMIIFYIGISGSPLEITHLPGALPENAGEDYPDIYYLILDEYPRADVLAADYSFDNQPFLRDLVSAGFFVATESQSNYAQTELSLASSLNFNYLNVLVPDLDPTSDDRSPLWSLIKQSSIMAILEQYGYTSVAFETGYSWSQIENADLYFGPSQGVGNTSAWGLTEFEVLYLRKTILLALYDARLFLPEFLTPELERPARRAYERTQLALDELASIPDLEGPHFVFAHLLVPHPPYVYGEDGEYIGDDYGLEGILGDEDALYSHNVTGHRRSISYINDRLLDLVSGWMESSDVPPVIVLQADHGVPFSSHDDRMYIFNAYFLPGEESDVLYAGISPVNTFRVILNQYFDADLPLLNDSSFFSGYDQPYNFEEIK